MTASESLVGKIVRFAHEQNGGPCHRVIARDALGMVELEDMGGFFAPHLFVVADDVAEIPPAGKRPRAMIWRPIAELPPELKNGRGLLVYGLHEHDSGREGGFQKGDHWWAIALWDVWRKTDRWVYALSGLPISWGEPTHFCELEPPA
jgi:hypothetical protein